MLLILFLSSLCLLCCFFTSHALHVLLILFFRFCACSVFSSLLMVSIWSLFFAELILDDSSLSLHHRPEFQVVFPPKRLMQMLLQMLHNLLYLAAVSPLDIGYSVMNHITCLCHSLFCLFCSEILMNHTHTQYWSEVCTLLLSNDHQYDVY